MESILPSEVARLVYGYLSSEGCKTAAQHFLEVSPHLRECEKLVKDGRRFNTRFHGHNLVQLLDLFTNIYSLVQDEAERMGQSSRAVSGEGLVMQLCQLLEMKNSFSKSNNSNTNITVPPPNEPNDKSRQGAAVRRRLAEPEGTSQGRSRSSSPGTSRRAKKDENSPPDDTVDFVLLNLLDNTELHEKIAEKINKVIATPEKESSTGTDVIKTIVKETEEDPWIQGLISEIISASAENEDGDTTAADNTEIDFRESLELQRNTNESAVEEKTPVPIKQRLRSSKTRSKVNSSDESVPPIDNYLGNLKNGKQKKQSDTSIVDNDGEPHADETERRQPEKKTCMLEAALSNCDINSSSETPQAKEVAKDKARIQGISPLKSRPDASDTNFCFVDVNEASQSSCVSPPPETAAHENQPIDTSNMIVLPNVNQIPNTTTSNLPLNSQIIFTPRNQNTTLMTLPSPLFGSGSIFTVIPPTATSTPAPNKNFSAVIVSEDPLKVPNNNIYTERDVMMAIPVTTTKVWDYVPITPKPEVPDSEATKKTKAELLLAARKRGQCWRRGQKGNIRKTIRVPITGGPRPILPKRPPVRTLKNVPHQKLVNGVEIEVLDGVTFNETSNTGLPTIIEFVSEDIPTAEFNAATNADEDQHEKDNEQNENQAEHNANLDKQNDGNTSPLVSASSPQNTDQLNTQPIIEVESEFLITNAEVKSNIKGTPGPLPRKKLSLSTPRRRNSHVRALDFNTPPKRFLGRRSNTSPKRVLSPRKSILNNVKRAKLFKSPNSSAQSNKQELVFKSPISKDPLPIATLSPARPLLKGEWDRVNGVQMIISTETGNGRKCKKESWDKDLRSLITDEYKDPSPPKKSTNKKKQSPKKVPRRRGSQKKGSNIVKPKTKKYKEDNKLEDILVHENVGANNVEGIEAEKENLTENDGPKTGEFYEKNNTFSKIETEVQSSKKNEVANKSKLSTVDSIEPNTKPTSPNNDDLENVDKGFENSKNTDNDGLLMVVEEEEEEETNVLDSSTMSESVLGLRIEENLRNIVGNKDKASKNKNDGSSSSDILNVLLDQNTKKTDGNKIEIRIESAEDCETAEVHSSSITNISVGTNLKVDTDFAIPVALLSNEFLNKPHGGLPILETPVKLDFAGLVPRTPYLDTPMLKTIRENTSVLSNDLLLTPSLPPTPFQEGASNSYSNLSDKTPNKGNLEDILIQECKRIEVEKSGNQNNNKSNTLQQDPEKNCTNNVEAEKSENVDKMKSKSNKKSPGKIKRKSVSPSKKSKSGKNKTKSISQDSKSSVKQKKKKKSSDQLIEAYLKQAKEELFGDDISSSSSEDIFEKKVSKRKNTSNSIYSMVYTDESSLDRMKRRSENNTPSKEKISPTKVQEKSKTKLIINDSNVSLDDKKQRMLNKMKGIVSPTSVSHKKTHSPIGISFNTHVTVPTSMEELVVKSQSPQKFCSSSTPEKSSASSSTFVPHKLPSLFTPPKLSNLTRTVDSINLRWHSPVISPCPKKAEHINDLADKIAKRKSNENNKDFPPLYLSPDSSESDDQITQTGADLKSEEIQKTEVRNFPIENRSEILKHKKSVDPINETNKQQMVNKEPTISSQVKQAISNKSTVFLSKNEALTTIVFDEINFIPKPVVKIDDFDNFQVDIVVDIDEGGKEIYFPLSLQPLQVLMDIDPKPLSSSKKLNLSNLREQCSQKPNSGSLSLRKHEKGVRDNSSNKSDFIDVAPKPVHSSTSKELNAKPREYCAQKQTSENVSLRKHQDTVRDSPPHRRYSMDVAPKTHHSSSSKEFKSSKSRDEPISENCSLRKHDRIRDTSTNRSDKHSPSSSRSRNRESRDKSVSRWADTTSRKMEYTRRSDGKRRIKPIRIDDYEYEARLNRREYERSRHEKYDDKTRSSSRHNRDKSRTRREEDRTHHSDSPRDYKRNNSCDKKRSESDTKYYMRTDQRIEEEDRRQKCESENELKQSRERTLVSYEDKEDAKSLTEDDLMNMAVTAGSSLTSSKRTEKRRSSHDTEDSPRKLPPKKRKASSDERLSDVPVKKQKTDGPQALLQKVDLDHFLSVVHGENSTASPPT